MHKFIDLAKENVKSIYRSFRFLYWNFRSKAKGNLPLPINEGNFILFLLPESGIHLYIKTLTLIASQLKMLGIRVIFARCYNIFQRCVFMDSEGLSIDGTEKQKRQLCTYCFKSFQEHVVNNNFEFVDLRHYVDDNDICNLKKDISNNLNQIFEFSHDGINFSGILEYNFFLFLKKSNFSSLSALELKLWQQYLMSLFSGYQAIKKLLSRNKISHVVMMDDYALNAVVQKLSTDLGISFTNISFPFHKDVDVKKISIFSENSVVSRLNRLQRWREFKHLRLPFISIKEAVDDLIVKMSKNGIYTYSPTKTNNNDLYFKLNLCKQKKTIVAYPSSPDELDAIMISYPKRGVKFSPREDAFNDQFEWLDELINFVECSQEFQLVIRMHPRMAANHREKWGCDVSSEFEARYDKVYKQVKIIWPSEDVSSFDLSEIADIATVSWSSMGIFMARLGIPVVSGLKYSLPIPNEKFHIFAKTKDAYFQNIQNCSKEGLNVNEVKESYRWYNMMYLGNCIDLEDIIPKNEYKLQSISRSAIFLKKTIVDNYNPLNINLNILRDQQNQNAENDENIAFIGQLSRLIHFFMTNRDLNTNEPEISIKDFVLNGKYVEYIFKGEKYLKYSSVISNLIKIVQSLSLNSREIRVGAQ